MKIISNTAMSLDGRISPNDPGHVAIGSEEDRRRMSQIRQQADAILVGGRTFRAWPIPLLPRPEHRQNQAPVFNVVVSRRMDFQLTERFLAESGIRPLFLTDRKDIPSDFPAEVVVAAEESSPSWIIDVLAARGVRTLLLEGGGEIIAPFVEAGLLNEMYVTVCPFLIGGEKTPRLMAGRGFSRQTMPQLALLSNETVGDEVFLHYKVLHHGIDK